MVFGGRTSLAPTTPAQARDVLYAEMVRVHPQLAGSRLEHSWGGNVAITFDRLPHCGRVPLPDGGDVAYATGLQRDRDRARDVVRLEGSGLAVG